MPVSTSSRYPSASRPAAWAAASSLGAGALLSSVREGAAGTAAAAADPLELSRSRAAGCASPCARRPVIGTNWYRYSVLYACAKEFTAALIQFSSQLLASIEKGDAEALRVLSARQSAKLLAFTKEVRKNTIEALDREKEALQIAKEAAKRRREYYKKLADENISGTEKAAIGQNMHMTPWVGWLQSADMKA